MHSLFILLVVDLRNNTTVYETVDSNRNRRTRNYRSSTTGSSEDGFCSYPNLCPPYLLSEVMSSVSWDCIMSNLITSIQYSFDLSFAFWGTTYRKSTSYTSTLRDSKYIGTISTSFLTFCPPSKSLPSCHKYPYF